MCTYAQTYIYIYSELYLFLFFLFKNNMARRGRAGATGNKYKMTLVLPVGAVINCADNTGAKNLYIVAVKGVSGVLNRLPQAGVGDMAHTQ